MSLVMGNNRYTRKYYETKRKIEAKLNPKPAKWWNSHLKRWMTDDKKIIRKLIKRGYPVVVRFENISKTEIIPELRGI